MNLLIDLGRFSLETKDTYLSRLTSDGTVSGVSSSQFCTDDEETAEQNASGEPIPY